jgi:ADP-dependent NAD(P)H-hydrate dehydratase / NAD(P)H-hydrate epimerase
MLYTIQQLRQIEQAAQISLGAGTLMRLAGQSAAQAALKLLEQSNQFANQPILVFAGPGNNGGDALVAAVHIAQADHNVFVLHHPPQSGMSPEYQQAFDQAKACPQLTWLDSDISLENSYALVVDGLFGIGLKPQPLPAVLHRQIEQINTLHCYHTRSFPVLALDVPSGLDADTGNLITPVAIQASHTITFIGDKPGLHTGHGRDFAGDVEVADLAIAHHLFSLSDMELNKGNYSPILSYFNHAGITAIKVITAS